MHFLADFIQVDHIIYCSNEGVQFKRWWSTVINSFQDNRCKLDCPRNLGYLVTLTTWHTYPIQILNSCSVSNFKMVKLKVCVCKVVHPFFCYELCGTSLWAYTGYYSSSVPVILFFFFQHSKSYFRIQTNVSIDMLGQCFSKFTVSR